MTDLRATAINQASLAAGTVDTFYLDGSHPMNPSESDVVRAMSGISTNFHKGNIKLEVKVLISSYK